MSSPPPSLRAPPEDTALVPALPLAASPSALVPYKASANALIRHTAFAPTDPTDTGDFSRVATTEVLTWGRNDMGQAMRGEKADACEPTPVPRLDRVRIVSVTCAAFNTMAVTDAGELFVAGVNDEGQLLHTSDSPDSCIRSPMLLEQLGTQRVISVASGNNHTCVLVASQAVLTWGGNEYGQLGHSPDVHFNAPPRAVRGIGSGHRRVIQVAAGSEHSLFLCVDGSVLACGNGAYGALGVGSRENRAEAAVVSKLQGVPITHIACGEYHSVATSKSGFVYAWGRNRYGQLGIPRTETPHAAYEPLRVPLPLLTQQADCGAMHTMFVSVTGQLWSCGRGTGGQLGLGKPTPTASLDAVDVPTHVDLGTDARIRQLACGDRHSLVLLQNGDVLGFGVNDAGQLGHKSVEDNVWAPTVVPSFTNAGVFHIAAGGDTSAAVRVTHGSVLSTAPGSLPRGAMVSMDAATLLVLSRMAAASNNTLPLQQVLRDVFSSPVVLNGSFLRRAEFQYFLVKTSPAEPDPDIGLPRMAAAIDAVPAAGAGSSAAGGPAAAASTAIVPMVATNTSPMASHSVSGPVIVDAMLGGVVDDMEASTEAWLNTSGVDVMGLNVAYSAVFSTRHPEVREVLLRSVLACVEALLKQDVSRFLEPDSLRCFIPMMIAPVFGSTSPAAITALHRLTALLDRLPEASKDLLYKWIAADVPGELLPRIVEPLQLHLSYYTSMLTVPDVPRADFNMAAMRLVVRVLARLHAVAKDVLPRKVWINDTVCQLPSPVLAYDFAAWCAGRVRGPSAAGEPPFSLCGSPFLFDADTKRRVLHIDASQRQLQAYQSSMFQQLIHGTGQPAVFELRVNRATLLDDTVLQLRSVMHPSQFKKPLKVVFVGEEAIDAGGVTKEFFQLLSARLFNPDFGMFVDLPVSHKVWFNIGAVDDSLGDFELIGKLVGLAIYNRVLLDITFPVALYKKLLGLPLTLEDLAEVEPAVGKSMQQLLDYAGDDVEDVFCLTFSYGYEDLSGERKTVNLKEGGEAIAVTNANRPEFVDLVVGWTLGTAVERQYTAFARGFVVVMDGPALELFCPEELDVLVSGTPDLEFVELEKVAVYDGGFTRTSPAVKVFWEVVHDMTPEQQRKLLLFVTGSAKAPIGGLGKLNLKIQRNGVDSVWLPTASTCFNTLLLPAYGDKATMRQRLLTAIEECAGFGLE